MNDTERASSLANYLKNANYTYVGHALPHESRSLTLEEMLIITSALRSYAKHDDLMDSQYRAGMKAGWNLCVDGDEDGFQGRMK